MFSNEPGYFASLEIELLAFRFRPSRLDVYQSEVRGI